MTFSLLGPSPSEPLPPSPPLSSLSGSVSSDLSPLALSHPPPSSPSPSPTPSLEVFLLLPFSLRARTWEPVRTLRSAISSATMPFSSRMVLRCVHAWNYPVKYLGVYTKCWCVHIIIFSSSNARMEHFSVAPKILKTVNCLSYLIYLYSLESKGDLVTPIKFATAGTGSMDAFTEE